VPIITENNSIPFPEITRILFVDDTFLVSSALYVSLSEKALGLEEAEMLALLLTRSGSEFSWSLHTHSLPPPMYATV